MRDAIRLLRGRSAALQLALVALIGLLLSGGVQAAPERRVALVVGNGAYQNVPALDNPVPDSKAVAAALKRIGFEVVEGYDLRLDALRILVGEYAAKLDGAKVALVYYAGHGIAVAGENYLLPTDTVLRNEADLDFRTMNISLVMRQMQRESRVNVIILDACRDNPFKAAAAQGARTRSLFASRGLAEISATSANGTLIAFATNPDETALDGTGGRHSPFTEALLKHIELPGVSISTVMDRVRSDVWHATNEKQRPWVSNSIIGEFSFNPVPVPPQALAPAATQVATADPSALLAVAPSAQVVEVKLWEAAERSGQPEDYRAYLDAYPNGSFAQVARNHLARAAAPAARAVEADLKEPATAAGEAALKLSQKDRAEAQMRLKALGFDPGGASGTFGPGTRRALTNWQKTRGIPESGFLSQGQRAALWEQSEADYRKIAAVRAPEPKARTIAAPRPPRPAPAQAQAQPAPQPQAQAQPQQQRGGGGGGGPSLGEMGSFFSGVGNLVGAVRR